MIFVQFSLGFKTAIVARLLPHQRQRIVVVVVL